MKECTIDLTSCASVNFWRERAALAHYDWKYFQYILSEYKVLETEVLTQEQCKYKQ